MTGPVLRGREGALGALRAGLTGALAGRGQLVVVSGEAGIGKSALAAAIAEDAEARGAELTWGRAWEFADAPPYFPVRPCLRAIGVPIEADAIDESRAFDLWETALAALARTAAEKPVVWILEDLHAADLGTLDLLAFLVQPVRALRVLVVATTRAHDPRLTDRKQQRLARMGRDGGEVRLEPLTEREIAAVTEDTLGHAIPEHAVRRLVELTGGNPLFVVECARAFRAAGGVEGTLGALPPTVLQVVVDRVALFPEATRAALACGAVLGREFAAATVARMQDTLPARVIDALLHALRAGIVREARPGLFVFSHTLVRDAIEDALAIAERARLHGRAEVALSALGDTADILVERARHAIAAARAGEPTLALTTTQRATELLEREGAFDRAFELHSRVDEARAAGLLPAATADEKLRIARVAREAGRSDVMRRLCEEVVVAARVSGDAELFARAVLLHATDVRPAVIDRLQVSLLEEVRVLLGDRSPAMTCRVIARLATALQPADDVSIPNALAREARAQAEALGDEETILDVLELGGLGDYGAPIAERIGWAEELRDRALRIRDLRKALTGWQWLAYWHIESGDFAAFDHAVANTLALANDIGLPRFRWGPLLLASSHALALGRFAESDRYVTEIAQLAPMIDDASFAFASVSHELMRAKLTRKYDEVRAALARHDAVLGDVKRGSIYLALQVAGCAARFDDVDATRAALVEIGLQARAMEADPDAMALLGEALALVGDDAERRRVRAAMIPMESIELFSMGVGFGYDGSIRRVIGLLDAALGDLVSAAHYLGGALALARERRHAPWVAQLALELSRVLRRAGREAEARALVDEHTALSRELGFDAAVPTKPEDSALRITLAGDVWTIQRAGATARIKDSRGVQLLARLVERTGEEIHVLALASDEGASAPESSSGAQLDDRARKQYRQRIIELDEELAAAESAGNATAARKLEREKQALVAELSRAVGLGGRGRQAGSASERARVNVQRRLKEAVARIGEADATLGAFFERAVRTGTFCCFRP